MQSTAESVSFTYSLYNADVHQYNLSFIVSNAVQIGKPIIAVSIPYRLSAWGFSNSQELRDEGNTNIGFRDQRLALQWINENIEAFGGDPTKVRVLKCKAK